MQLKHRKQAGDTLVEVLLAFAIFGMAATTIIRTMNDGFSRMFSSGQQSQVQALMRGQISIVQAAHNAEVKDPSSTAWDTLIDEISNDPSGSSVYAQAAVNGDGCTYTLNKNRLYFATEPGDTWTEPQKEDAITAPAGQAVTVETVAPSPDGISMWIEAKHTPHGSMVNGTANQGRGYYDFYVKACWSDGRINKQLKTVTRLYELIPAPGEGSPVTPTAPPAAEAVNPIEITGNAFANCVTLSNGEGTEAAGPPSYPLFSSPDTTGSFPCRNTADGGTYSCSNYDIGYASQVTVPGKYLLTVEYRDALCSSGAAQALNAAGAYSYRVQVYLNNAVVGNMILNPDVSQGTVTLDSVPPGAALGFRWWNNHWFSPADPSGKDPDFVITRLRLDKI